MKKELTDKWISVKDELPELKHDSSWGKYSDRVLCLHSDGHHEDCQFNHSRDFDDPYWSYIQDGELCETVTHWMPLPSPPV